MTVHLIMTPAVAGQPVVESSTVASDGDVFVLDNAGSVASIQGLSNTTAMVFGYGDLVDTYNYGAGSQIYDHGHGTRIEVDSGVGGVSDTATIQVWGFYWDQNSSLVQCITGSNPAISGPGSKPTLFYQADLWATIRPDGHGGTMIGAGGVNIDLMYDTYIRSGQLLGPGDPGHGVAVPSH